MIKTLRSRRETDHYARELLFELLSLGYEVSLRLFRGEFQLKVNKGIFSSCKIKISRPQDSVVIKTEVSHSQVLMFGIFVILILGFVSYFTLFGPAFAFVSAIGLYIFSFFNGKNLEREILRIVSLLE
ncbi:MAG: hypothetical protein ACE5K0_00165 [Candidatus Methanofastidiosia archaeon]